MRVLSIALKDLHIFFTDRGALSYLFLLPLIFIVLFAGLASAGAGATPAEEADRVPLLVVNEDGDTPAVAALVEELNDAGGIVVRLADRAEAQEALRHGQTGRVLVIPAGFSAEFAAGRQAELRLESHPDADETALETIWRVVQGAAYDVALESQILAGLEQIGAMQAGSPAGSFFTPDRLAAQARFQFEHSRAAPLVGVERVKPARLAAQDEAGDDFDYPSFAVAGFAVLFVFLGAQATARSIYDEKLAGSFRRLLAAPLRRGELLAGKVLPNLVISLIQIGVIFAAGALLLPLLGWSGLPVGRNLPGVALVAFVIALCAAAMGVFIVALARTETQMSGVSQAILWVAGVVGGSFVPSFVLPAFLNAVGRLTPHYWANQALQGLLLRGQGVGEIAPALGALLVFAAVFFGVGIWRFRFE